MKQLLQNLRSGATIIADVPVPVPQPGEVQVRTAVSLVSAGTERMVVEFAEKSLLGKARSRPDLVRQLIDKARREGVLSTLEAAFNRLDQLMPLGYSSAGTITALGSGVGDLQVGQRVACAGGGYAVHAEYAAVPRNLVTVLPEGVDFEAAAFTTLGAIALHGFRLAEAQLGETVAVIGLGLLGLLAAQLARAAGCRVIGVDVNPGRVALAERLGLRAVLRTAAVEAALGFSQGRGCDAVLICADTASADPVQLAGAIARDRARVVAVGAVGLQLPRKVYYEKELTFINSRSYGPGRYDPAYEEGGRDYPLGYVRWTEGRNLEAFVELLRAGQVDVRPLISHRFPIEQASEAYALITGKRREPFLGVLLTYPGEPTTSGAAPAAVSVSPTPQIASTLQAALTERMEFAPLQTVRLGVLGAGNFANAVLLPAISKVGGAELLAIASASGVSAQQAANKFGFRRALSEEEAVIGDPEINTVAILTRHHLHARQVCAALQAGKHVFCEKPLALTPDELSQVAAQLDSARGERPLLLVGFNRRFAPLARRLHEFLKDRSEPLAANYRVNAGYIPLTHWVHDPEQGGGRIIGEACHFIDFLTFLVGAAPQEVFCQGLPDGGRYRSDNVLIVLRFPDGSLGTISYLANGDKAFPKERVEVFCGGRVAVLDDFRSLETVWDGHRQVYRSRWQQDKGHRGEWQAFMQALQAGGPPPIPYPQLFGAMQATLAAVDALHLRSSVMLTLPPG